MVDEPVARLPLPRNLPNISRPRSEGKVEDTLAEVRDLDLVPRLVARAQEGDRDAFAELYRIHFGAIFRLARFSLGADAEDAVADTFLRAWTGLPRYRAEGAPFAAWLYGIARHVVADELTKRKRSEPRADVPDRPIDLGEDDRLTLAAAIERLPTEQRQVIELKYLVGLRNPEVAAALGVSVGAVNAKQWRALAALQEMLKEQR